MPYIGNNHIAGDHTNNFKVLDDISSFTATFDGSATSVVDTTNNTIRVVEHRFIQGQRVTYTNGSGGNIGGLTTGTAYFVIFDSASTIKLATSASNAANSTAINLSAVGSGTSHTLNAAFDGVNTKFKLTHGSGTGARLNNATQINVAINNVLQRPNLDPNNFTDGFALEDNHKIVFQTAPTSEDIFWGSIIANTLTTFDISDHKIDTFTGDGSTTEFTLSHTPANNESLMVTINGVLQHPSNASTARAYTLIASIIQFTAAPGVGDEIQVRHMGFAGATTADVSGFYGRTGNVVLTSNDHITTGNINAGIVTATSFHGSFSPNVGGSNANFTGIVTAGTFKGGNIDAVDGAFSGNVTIGGTLTYEDVTNIDSVGIITAQTDVHVGAGLSVVGVSTLTGRIFAGGTSIPGYTGADDLTIGTESGHHGITVRSGADKNGAILFSDATSAGDNSTQWAGGVEYNHGNGELRFYQGGTVRGMFQGSGHFTPWLDSTGALGTTSKRWSNVHADAATIAGDLDVDGHTNLDNVNIAGVTTAAGNIRIANNAPSLIFDDQNHSVDYTLIADANQFKLTDTSNGDRIIFSANGSTSIVAPTFVMTGGAQVSSNLGVTGNLILSDIIYHDGDTDTRIRFPAADTISMETAGSERLRITSTGNIGVAGATGTDFSLLDGMVINTGNGKGGLLINSSSSSHNAYIGFSYGSGSSTSHADQFSAYIGRVGDNTLVFGTNNSIRAQITSDGHVVPNTDSQYDLGLTGTRWRNLYADTLYGDGSNLTGITQTTINSNTDHYLITATGTANTLQGESGLQWNGTSLTLDKSTNAYLNPDINIYNSYNGGYGGSITFSGKMGGSKYSQARIRVYGGSNSSDGSLAIETGNMGEKFRISSAGKVLIGDGTAITPSRNLDVRGSGHQQILLGSTNNAGVSLMLDGHGGGDGSGGNYGTVEMGSNGHLDIRNYDPAKNIVFGVGSNTGAEDTLVLTSDGNLGLSNTGTNNPNNYSGWTTLTLNGSSGSELDFEKAGTLHGDIYANATRFAMTTRDSNTDIFFATKNNAGSTADRLQISSEGNIRHVDGSGVSYFNGASEYVFGSTGSSPASGGAEANVQIHAHKTRAQFSINAYMNNAGGPFMQMVSSRSSTVGTLGTVTLNNDYLGDIRFGADDGNGGVVYGAAIQARAKTQATTNGIAARIEFSTAKDASSTTRQVFSMNEGGALTGESSNAALYGYYTSVNNTANHVDFAEWTRDSFICLEIFGNVNPNSSGSGAYSDPVHMYVYKGTGWTGSRVGYYIYCVSVAPPARQAFPSGTGYSGNAQISAVWTDGSSNLGNETATSTNYLRLLIPNGNSSNNFPKQFRIFRRR